MQSLSSMRSVKASARAPGAARQAPVVRAVARAPRPRALVVSAAFAPPTVSETKAKFTKAYPKPIPAVYSTVLQELLVQHHFVRFSSQYAYNPVFALGFVNVFEQVLESIPSPERAAIFKAYITSLDEDPDTYRKDAEAMESQASSLSGPDQLTPGSGSELQQALATVASAAAAGKFAYNRFFAIGLFRLLELTGAKEPSALERLVKAVNVAPEKVNKDLMMYKSVLSKLSAAKELMKELMDREKRKAAERAAEKEARANKSSAESEAQPASA